MSYDPTKIRPKGGWVSVLAKPRAEKLESGLFLPTAETGVEKVTESEGTIIRVGINERTKVMGLEPGQRIFYRGYLKYPNALETDEKWPNGQKKEYFFMAADDIFGEVAPGVEIGVFSSPNVNKE
jgi:co-chaperonin GroES (HSP10)